MADGWDFFVSYTAADRDWAEWVAWQLEEAHHKVLVQAWDIVPGDNWVARMQDGVQRAERTIAILSTAYTTSVYGTAEWLAAWRADPLGAERRLLVLRVEACERPGLLAAVGSVDLFGVPEPQARDLLDRAVRGAVEGRLKPDTAPSFPGARAVASQPRFPGTLPPVWNVPTRNPNFTGRLESLARLRRAVRSSGTVAVHSLRGLGGVGKSQLVIEYAHRHADDFDLAWWIPAEQVALVPDHLAALGAELGVELGGDHHGDPEATTAAVLADLRRRQRWLVVFDNAEDPVALRPYLPSGGGQVLVTTRRGGFGALGEVLDVDVLDRAESVELLKRRVPAITDESADTLADWFGDLPLAIEQASAYLEATGLPVPAYLDLLRTRTAEMIGRGRVADRSDTLATLWELSLTELAAKHPSAGQLLAVLAWLAPEPVPLDLFTAHVDALPAPLAEAAADPVAFADTVGALVSRFLVRRDGDEITIAHRLLQRSLRVRASAAAERTALAETAQRLLRTDLPDEVRTSAASWPRWRALLPHVLGVHDDVAENPGAVTPHTIPLLENAAAYLQTHGRPAEALPLLESIVAVHEPDHPGLAGDLTALALALHELGRTDAAIPLLHRAIARDEARHGPDHPAIAIRLAALGLALRTLGRPHEARPHHERALAIAETAYGRDHPAVADRLYGVGHTLLDLGLPDEARPLFERALAIAETTHGPDDPAVAGRLQDLATVLEACDRHGEALLLRRRALAIVEASRGPRHADLAPYLNSLGRALGGLGRSDDARVLHERALAICEEVYGPDHPVLVSALGGLALSLRGPDHSDEVRRLYERAVAIDESAYGPGHPRIAAGLHGLALTLLQADDHLEALSLFERALSITETAYGPDHPQLITHLEGVGLALRMQDREDESVQVYERALAIATTLHGSDHPKVAELLDKLAEVRRAPGDHDDGTTSAQS
ncbi:FxSxx-COOH system tetratricopeptide repeat protein [Actinosynnema sp. NPDC051121]